METIVLASNNKHKIREFKEIMKNYNIVTMEEIGFHDEIVENGKTLFENSLIKSKTISKYLKEKGLNYMVVADDTGLEVDALNGEPGVYSARYASDHNPDSCRKLVLKNMENITDPHRTAHFTCVVTLIKPDGTTIEAVGRVDGKILDHEVGNTNFGYDSIFYCTDLKKTFGECSDDEKNSVSHRGRAIENLLKKLG